jgi:hypothetical protein
MLQVAASVGPIGGTPVRAPLVVEEGAGAFRSLDDDIATAAPGAAFGATAWLAPLSLERGNSRPAVAGAQVDAYLIYEHNWS